MVPGVFVEDACIVFCRMARGAKSMVREGCSSMSRGMGQKTAKRTWEPKQFHTVGEPPVRQRAAGSKLRAGCLARVCHGKQYGLYLLGQQRILNI